MAESWAATLPHAAEMEPVEVALAVGGMTCSSCERRIASTVRSLPGVIEARPCVAENSVRLKVIPGGASSVEIADAIRALGYVVCERGDAEEKGSAEVDHAHGRRGVGIGSWRVSVIGGAAASAALLAFYVGLVSLAQDFDHARELLLADWYLVGAIVAGFGVQVGLFVRMRRLIADRRARGSSNALAAAGTGTSSVSMLACCAHHLGDLAPLLGLSGAAAVMSEYRVPLMLVGIATNAAGIWFMARQLRRLSAPAPGRTTRGG